MSVISAASLNSAQAASLLGISPSTTPTDSLWSVATAPPTVDLVALSSAALLDQAEAVTGVDDGGPSVELSELSTTAVGQLLSYTQSGDVIGAMLGAPSGLNLLV